MKLSDNFLWGGATAANQYEGGYLEDGKGLSIAYVERGGKHGTMRVIDDSIEDGVFIQVMKQQIFIIIIKKILHYLQKWVLNVIE